MVSIAVSFTKFEFGSFITCQLQEMVSLKKTLSDIAISHAIAALFPTVFLCALALLTGYKP